ncbi:hypothetical protein [Streptomyces sp. enrichment culture]|uniref:hypothetical protein n=1 Tax=Streptomyces sp. enrichment culture TaxID=1795815 RepID=UPI003F54ACFF
MGLGQRGRASAEAAGKDAAVAEQEAKDALIAAVELKQAEEAAKLKDEEARQFRQEVKDFNNWLRNGDDIDWGAVLSDGGHFALDVLGLIPGFGEAPTAPTAPGTAVRPPPARRTRWVTPSCPASRRPGDRRPVGHRQRLTPTAADGAGRGAGARGVCRRGSPDTPVAPSPSGTLSAAEALRADQAPPGLLEVLRRDLHPTAEQAQHRLVNEAGAGAKLGRLAPEPGDDHAGSRVGGADASRLTVATTDPGDVTRIERAGARAVAVEHPPAALDAAKAGLDRAARKAATDKRPSGMWASGGTRRPSRPSTRPRPSGWWPRPGRTPARSRRCPPRSGPVPSTTCGAATRTAWAAAAAARSASR